MIEKFIPKDTYEYIFSSKRNIHLFLNGKYVILGRSKKEIALLELLSSCKECNYDKFSSLLERWRVLLSPNIMRQTILPLLYYASLFIHGRSNKFSNICYSLLTGIASDPEFSSGQQYPPNLPFRNAGSFFYLCIYDCVFKRNNLYKLIKKGRLPREDVNILYAASSFCLASAVNEILRDSKYLFLDSINELQQAYYTASLYAYKHVTDEDKGRTLNILKNRISRIRRCGQYFNNFMNAIKSGDVSFIIRLDRMVMPIKLSKRLVDEIIASINCFRHFKVLEYLIRSNAIAPRFLYIVLRRMLLNGDAEFVSKFLPNNLAKMGYNHIIELMFYFSKNMPTPPAQELMCLRLEFVVGYSKRYLHPDYDSFYLQPRFLFQEKCEYLDSWLFPILVAAIRNREAKVVFELTRRNKHGVWKYPTLNDKRFVLSTELLELAKMTTSMDVCQEHKDETSLLLFFFFRAIYPASSMRDTLMIDKDKFIIEIDRLYDKSSDPDSFLVSSTYSDEMLTASKENLIGAVMQGQVLYLRDLNKEIKVHSRHLYDHMLARATSRIIDEVDKVSSYVDWHSFCHGNIKRLLKPKG